MADLASFSGSIGGRWLDRLALVLALIAVLLNISIAVQYGWLAGWLPWEVMQDDGAFITPGDIAAATAPLAVVGALWYLTPALWLLVTVRWLMAAGSRIARVAMVLATLSVLTFVLLVSAFGRLAW